MVHWFMVILTYNLTILKVCSFHLSLFTCIFMCIQLSVSEVTLSLRLLHYKNRNGLTYENRPCDTRYEHDINGDGRCDTAFLFCLVRLPFRNPHNCTLGDHFTGFVGADDIHFINVNQHQEDKFDAQSRSTSSLNSLWYQPMIYFRFQYPEVNLVRFLSKIYILTIVQSLYRQELV